MFKVRTDDPWAEMTSQLEQIIPELIRKVSFMEGSARTENIEHWTNTDEKVRSSRRFSRRQADQGAQEDFWNRQGKLLLSQSEMCSPAVLTAVLLMVPAVVEGEAPNWSSSCSKPDGRKSISAPYSKSWCGEHDQLPLSQCSSALGGSRHNSWACWRAQRGHDLQTTSWDLREVTDGSKTWKHKELDWT